MFVVVGRIRFRPMGQDERRSMIQLWEKDFSPMARESPGFHGVHFVQLSDDELMTDWRWDSEEDWEAAQARLGSGLSCSNTSSLTWLVLPKRVGGEVVLQVTP
jgi:hypothetical protein